VLAQHGPPRAPRPMRPSTSRGPPARHTCPPGRVGRSPWSPLVLCCLIRPVSMGFHECFMHIKYSATSAKFHFLHETLRREKERVSPRWNLWAQFHMHWKLCETPIETQIEFHHATMQLNHTMRERLWDSWAYETVQWNYALRETSISYQSFTFWKPGRWNYPLRLALLA
jgi:hypothetical protein